MPYEQLEAFGESKTLRAWANDPRCVVRYPTLRDRFQRIGMPLEEAMTKPSQHGPHSRTEPELHPFVARLRAYRINVAKLTVAQLAERLGEGWNASRLTSYELGRVAVKLEDAIQWAAALGLTIELHGDEPAD
jgi:hypothetical protein